MEPKRIAVLGDAMLDVWTDLRTTRHNPEDPSVPVVVLEKQETKPGGALNVAANLSAMGHRVTFVDVVGRSEDDYRRLLHMLGTVGVGYFKAAHMGPTPVTRKERVRLDGRLLYRKDTDHRPVSPAPVHDVPFLWGDAVVLVDYGKGALETPLVRTIMAQEDALIVLDAKPDLHRAFLGWRECWGPNVVLKANKAEATAVAGPSPVEWMRRTDNKVRMTVVTDGENGALMCNNKGHPGEVQPDTLLAASPFVCGAGDVFTAALTDALLRGQTEWQATQSAVNAATRMTSSGQTETLCLTEDALFTDPDLVA